MAEIQHTIGDPIVFRYDGLDASQHVVEMSALAESLKGLSRIAAVAGNFAATQKYVQQKGALAVRVMVLPSKQHCYEVSAVIQWVNQNALATTVVGGLTVTLISYIFTRLASKRAEMKELRAALETAIRELGNRDVKVIEHLLSTVDNMADALRPSARQAVSPIGGTVGSLSIRSETGVGIPTTIGQAERDAIVSADEAEILSEAVYQIEITEMNWDSSGCKVAMGDEPDPRVSAVITDPEFEAPNNPYATAFAAKASIKVKAKAAVKDGKIEKLYISNTV